jgi:hypothetical protein
MCSRCYELPKADFEEFLVRRRSAVLFANREIGPRQRFYDRHWPALQLGPGRHPRLKRQFIPGHCRARWNRVLDQTCKLAEARWWIPLNPPEVHHMRVNDAKRGV